MRYQSPSPHGPSRCAPDSDFACPQLAAQACLEDRSQQHWTMCDQCGQWRITPRAYSDTEKFFCRFLWPWTRRPAARKVKSSWEGGCNAPTQQFPAFDTRLRKPSVPLETVQKCTSYLLDKLPLRAVGAKWREEAAAAVVSHSTAADLWDEVRGAASHALEATAGETARAPTNLTTHTHTRQLPSPPYSYYTPKHTTHPSQISPERLIALEGGAGRHGRGYAWCVRVCVCVRACVRAWVGGWVGGSCGWMSGWVDG